MATNICVQCRVSEAIKEQFALVAQRQQLTESAFLRRLVEQALSAAGPSEAQEGLRPKPGTRSERIAVRLLPDDRQLLEERAHARGMRPGTYLSVLSRAHLRRLAPLTSAELHALKRAIAELGAIGRNLNQIARVANQTGQTTGPTREELRALLRACEGLKDHVAHLIKANLDSWETGS